MRGNAAEVSRGDEGGRIMAFVSPVAYTRFLTDFGWLMEAHHRHQLYSPSARSTTRKIVAAFQECVVPSTVPAITQMMETIIEDIDIQEAFEKEHDDELRNNEKSTSEKEIYKVDKVIAAPAFDQMTFPMTARETLDFHARCSLLAVITTIASILKAKSWCVQPGTMANVQLWTYAYFVIFWIAARSSATVHAWLIREFEGNGSFPKWVTIRFINVSVTVGPRTLTSKV
jgi:hypothetical protein